MENIKTTTSIDEIVNDFIFRTYKIWKSGDIVHIITNSNETVESNTYDEYKILILNALEYSISSILEKTCLYDNQFFIFWGGDRNNTFILTDKRLFISTKTIYKKNLI